METIYEGNNARPAGKYNNCNGRVKVTVDTTLVTNEAIVKGAIKRKAQADINTGNRSQRHKLVMLKFERLLKQADLCDDLGKNAVY
jgi:hypothetical protein